MKRASVLALFACMVAIGAVYAATFVAGHPPSWSVWVFAGAISVAMVATMTLGAARSVGGIGRLAIPFALTLAILLAGFSFALLLPAANEPLWLGLPRRAAIVVYGIGLLPLLLLPVAYALTFDEATLSDEDLRRIREIADKENAHASDRRGET